MCMEFEIKKLRMKAGYLIVPKNIKIRDVEIPEPKFGEVRVKLSKIGICGSDVHIYLGHRLVEKPIIIGHEGFGIIDKIGEGVENRILGERVVIEPNIPCRNCKYCLSARGTICSNKKVLGVNQAGCFAEYIVIPSDFAWKVSDEISDENAVTIEPMAVAYHALLSSKAKPGDTIAVIGLGAIGLLLAHLAIALGYKVFVTEINESKIKLAIQIGGIPANSVGNEEEQILKLSKIWDENNVVAVFECAGSAITASLVTASAPRGSEIVLVGLSEKLATFTPLKIAREGITIVPSIVYDHPFDFKRVLQLVKSKVINPSFIISREMPLEDLQNALEIAAKGDDSKIIIHV
jgi:L-iditol 2-dehydrogenase